MASNKQAIERLKKKLAAIPADAREEIRKGLRSAAEDIVSTARNFAPVDDGDLRNSIGYTFGEYRAENANVRGVQASGKFAHDLQVTVHAGDAKAFYASFVEFGTKPHRIEPKKRGGSLFFEGSGVDAVNHPGAKATPFFFPAYRANKKRAVGKINRAIKRAAQKAANGG